MNGTDHTAARAAWNAYTTINPKSVKGDPLPTWDELCQDPEKAKVVEGWVAAATAVVHAERACVARIGPKTSQDKVADFMEKAKQDVPKLPNIPNVKTAFLRVVLIAEETHELAGEGHGLFSVFERTEDGGFIFYCRPVRVTEPRLQAIMDAHADIQYVNDGGAVAVGLPLDPFFNEVHRSNMTKFIDGHENEDGKWVKGPSYEKADLGAVLEAILAKHGNRVLAPADELITVTPAGDPETQSVSSGGQGQTHDEPFGG